MELIVRHRGSVPNNFIYTQDGDLVLAIGKETTAWLNSRGESVAPYIERLPADLIADIIAGADELYFKNHR